MHRISKRFLKGVATLEDVVRVYQAAQKVGALYGPLFFNDATDISPANWDDRGAGGGRDRSSGTFETHRGNLPHQTQSWRFSPSTSMLD